jgi:putative sterol carrier protein
MNVAESFELLPTLFDPTAAKGLIKTIQWNITGEQASVWAVKIANQTCELIPGGIERADLTMTIKDTDWLAIANGTLDAMMAFVLRKVKTSGDTMLAMRVSALFPLKKG